MLWFTTNWPPLSVDLIGPHTCINAFAFVALFQGYNSPTQDLANTKHKYLSSSLSRFDRVRRRQILQMRKRSNWFLSPNPSTSIDTESALGSREASVGKCSIDAMSSDALLSDVTASDGAMSETRDTLGLSSDLDSTYGEHELHHEPHHEPLRRLHAHNNHRMSTPVHGGVAGGGRQRLQLQRPQDSPGGCSQTQSQGSSQQSSRCASPQVTDTDVKYFMVERIYGAAQSKNSWETAFQPFRCNSLSLSLSLPLPALLAGSVPCWMRLHVVLFLPWDAHPLFSAVQ